jgi:23S rRNA pseudouridine1911/1915/1917 synthase
LQPDISHKKHKEAQENRIFVHFRDFSWLNSPFENEIMVRKSMHHNEQLIVEEGQDPVRLDSFLAERVPEISRSHWKTLIQSGHVMLNGAASKPNHKLRPGDVIDWTVPAEAPAETMPEDIPLNVLYEDAEVLVLNKPPGLVVHPAAGNETGTLVNALLFHDPVFAALDRAGIVHRLDKDTSGVMVVAKSDAAVEELKRQFKARETQKEYLALVWGAPPPTGCIETLMGRHPVQRKKMAVLSQDGREAVSNYETLERFDEVSLVRVVIETGRTHQIRVHLAHIGHPIVGDAMYGRSRRHTLPEKPSRQMLHAAQLAFNHPDTGKRLSFEAPLFEDISWLLEQLRGG